MPKRALADVAIDLPRLNTIRQLIPPYAQLLLVLLVGKLRMPD